MAWWPAGRFASRCAGAAVGVMLDRATPELPNEVHPVAWFGRAMSATEHAVWADRRSNGVAYTVIGVGLGALAGCVVRSVPLTVLVTVAGRQLRQTGEQIGERAANGSLEEARSALPALVGRDPSQLDTSGIAAAVIESVAENAVDAVIAPVFWAVVAGAPGSAAYRAINTMDAMVGRRNDRYGNFGWASARLDDVANYIPARIFGALVMAQTPARAGDLFRIVRRDAPAHPSPNAGVAESVVAASLGRQLGGPLRYGSVVEDRPTLGDGPRPTPIDIPAATAITNRVELSAVGVLALLGLLGSRRG